MQKRPQEKFVSTAWRLGVAVFALAVVAAGCGGGEDPGTDAGGPGTDALVATDSGGGGGSDSATMGGGNPTSGLWLYLETAVLNDTCLVGQTPSNGAGDFLLTNNGNGTFVIDPEDGSEVFNCTLAMDGSYDCPARLDTVIDTGGVIDAVVELHVSASGVFSSNTTGTGEQNGTATCTGTECAIAEGFLGTTFPCQVDVAFDIWLP